MNNFIYIVLDSCRFDTFQQAWTPNIDRLGKLHQCYSYASWTTPAHAVYLMGVSPHRNPKGVFASEVYKDDFLCWQDRLDIPDVSFKGFVPELSLPSFLKQHGYRTCAYVSMPVLNHMTIFNQHFDEYELMAKHNDFNAIIDKFTFSPDQPSFYFCNIGETHYPYTLPNEKADDLPIIHGVHGVFKHMDEFLKREAQAEGGQKVEFFSEAQMQALFAKQKDNVGYLDSLFEKIYDMAPPNTYILVTSDHGELFGEDNYFGHGPIFHEKVFQVPLVEGKIN